MSNVDYFEGYTCTIDELRISKITVAKFPKFSKRTQHFKKFFVYYLLKIIAISNNKLFILVTEAFFPQKPLLG